MIQNYNDNYDYNNNTKLQQSRYSSIFEYQTKSLYVLFISNEFQTNDAKLNHKDTFKLERLRLTSIFQLYSRKRFSHRKFRYPIHANRRASAIFNNVSTFIFPFAASWAAVDAEETRNCRLQEVTVPEISYDVTLEVRGRK